LGEAESLSSFLTPSPSLKDQCSGDADLEEEGGGDGIKNEGFVSLPFPPPKTYPLWRGREEEKRKGKENW